MAEQSLREALMALPGVAQADVDETGGAPSGVRVTLAPDADGRLVGAEVQRVLATHGLRSRITAGDDAIPEAVAAVPQGNGPPSEDAPPAPPVPAPPATPPPAPPAPTTPPPEAEEITEEGDAEAILVAGVEPERPDTVERTAAPNVFELASVSIAESADHVTVTASSVDGRSHTVDGAPSEEGLFNAVVAAVGTLAGGHPPVVVSVDAVRTAGSEVVTVVLEDPEGRRHAGASVVMADRAFATARATVAAIRNG